MTPTLLNFRQFTPLEVLDFVAEKLLAQGKTALEKGVCFYRAQDGCKCAVGHLIPEESYDRNMEGKPISNVLEILGVGMNQDEADFFDDLRIIHDRKDPSTWGFELSTLRKDAEVCPPWEKQVAA